MYFSFPFAAAEFVQGLTSYEIAVPVKVNEHGHFESHTLEHSLNQYSSRRSRRDTSTQDDTTLHYKVTVEGLDLHLRVTPSHKLFAPGLVFEHRKGRYGNHTNARITRVLGNRCHFEGEITDHPGSQVALATCNGLVSTVFILRIFCSPVVGEGDAYNVVIRQLVLAAQIYCQSLQLNAMRTFEAP